MNTQQFLLLIGAACVLALLAVLGITYFGTEPVKKASNYISPTRVYDDCGTKNASVLSKGPNQTTLSIKCTTD
jgi:hypothetical protein